MLHGFFVSVFVVLWSSTMLASTQSGTIQGRVVQDGLEVPVCGVSMTIEGRGGGTTTDTNGEFILRGIEEQLIEIPTIVVEHVMLTGEYSGVVDVPGSAYYIGPQQLEYFRYDDIQRILGSVPGVNIQEEDGYGLRLNIGLRGMGAARSSKITIMEDGV